MHNFYYYDAHGGWWPSFNDYYTYYIKSLDKKKENTTMSTTTQSLEFQITKTEEALKALKAELESVRNPYGEDRFGDATVLRFSMRYHVDGPSYRFAVLKSAGKWYPSGSLGQQGRTQRTWEALCDNWATYNVKAKDIAVMVPSRSLGSWQAQQL